MTLGDLLTADYNLLIFGDPHCSGCRSLLMDHGVNRYIRSRSAPAYFLNLVKGSESELADVQTSFEIVEVEEDAIDDYAIDNTPFGYVITRAGVIGSAGAVVRGLGPVKDLFEQAFHDDSTATVASAHVSHSHQASH